MKQTVYCYGRHLREMKLIDVVEKKQKQPIIKQVKRTQQHDTHVVTVTVTIDKKICVGYRRGKMKSGRVSSTQQREGSLDPSARHCSIAHCTVSISYLTPLFYCDELQLQCRLQRRKAARLELALVGVDVLVVIVVDGRRGRGEGTAGRARDVLAGLAELDLAHALGEAQRAQRLRHRLERGRQLDEHERLGVLLQRVLQQVRQHRVAVRDVLVLVGARRDDVAERRERVVDLLCLLERLARNAGARDALGAGQVDEVQLAHARLVRDAVAAAGVHGENEVRARRVVVHVCARHVAVAFALGEVALHVVGGGHLDLGQTQHLHAVLALHDLERHVLMKAEKKKI